MISLLGLPTDINSSHLRGAAGAPPAIRRVLASGMMNSCAEDGTDIFGPNGVADKGDLSLKEDDRDFERIAAAARDLFRQGPAIFLGGDHFVTWPILAGRKEATLAPVDVIHVDAHPDLYPDFEGNPKSHASPFARCFENGLIASLTQIGVRTINPVQRAQIDKYAVRVFTPDDVPVAAHNLPSRETYFSIDLDGLDPAFAPGVSHHEPGGLSVRDVLRLIREAPGRIIGGDIVEYNPARDAGEMTAAVAAKILKELAARIARDQR